MGINQTQARNEAGWRGGQWCGAARVQPTSMVLCCCHTWNIAFGHGEFVSEKMVKNCREFREEQQKLSRGWRDSFVRKD